MRTLLINCALLLFFILGFGSCKKFVTPNSPAESLPSSQLFETEQGVLSAVAGLYSEMTTANLILNNGGITVHTGFSGDELYTPNPNFFYDAYFKNSLSATETFTIGARFWTPAYKTIYQANAILEGIQKSSSLRMDFKKQIQGEMQVVRAMQYFYLVNLFGDVPYQTTTDYLKNAKQARTSSSSIYQSLVKDLIEAKDLLPATYPATLRTRPNKWAAASLLSRIYLYQKDWANAEIQATDLLNSGVYSLNPSLDQVFLPSSPEVIWQLQRENYNTAEANAFIPFAPSVIPGIALTTDLMNTFEAGDLRKTSWTGYNAAGTDTFYYPYKYKNRNNTPVEEYETVFRLAELYLIRAEARAQQNKLNESLADINFIRDRAGLSPLSLPSQQSLLDALAKERRIELFAEWGHRWFDLKRTEKANEILSLLKGSNWQSTDVLYPIPFNELQINNTLTQNPGY